MTATGCVRPHQRSEETVSLPVTRITEQQELVLLVVSEVGGRRAGSVCVFAEEVTGLACDATRQLSASHKRLT